MFIEKQMLEEPMWPQGFDSRLMLMEMYHLGERTTPNPRKD